jgi:hypothetical protein
MLILDATLGNVTLTADRALTLAVSLQGTPQAPFTLYVPLPERIAGPGQCSVYFIANATPVTCFVQTETGSRAPCYAGHGNLILIDPLGNAQLFG